MPPSRGYASLSSSAPVQRPMCIFSGIQPTGVPHIGNLLGALFNWVSIQNSLQASRASSSSTPPPELYFSIVGLHALTIPQNPATLAQERKDMLASLLAIGLDPEQSTIYHQDEVGEHAQLHWLLSCLVSMGRLRRMTTWKGKIATARGTATPVEPEQGGPTAGEADEGIADVDEEHRDLSLGLFSYPVLQAADILLYKATHVPIGQDQVQHLELARDIAATFNKRFPSSHTTPKSSKSRREPPFFPLPQPLITSTPKILSLRDPTAKMSKSAPDPASRILLTDDDTAIRAKVKRAVTDTERSISFDPEGRPGVSSLLSIIAALRSYQAQQTQSTLDPFAAASAGVTPKEVAQQLDSSGGGHALLKETVTSALIEVLGPIRERFQQLKEREAQSGYLEQVAALGREKASVRAKETLGEVKERMGLR
ncbi:tryptophanyl-tRNA synthetase [Microstroma glucosiphilum]|uniref:tryptophan--tRNA ligase n=1 Tax=Pseudomicrostroma glucosiphilum TaxID=1684307 RepID=A0A316U165_9BASI|nr:tryptophanyl-tRNA synthetase [Pseudomicrostroma glucosiphilum]PWN18940.1 tryptophanyl-tRNA synthetase [Pseudomicrostroma glucosiphilum]